MLKSDEKGFSLIELITVMAIIAVLIAVLAPQYLKYVNNTRVVTDVTNAREIARFLDAAVAGENGASVPTYIQGKGGTPVNGVAGMEALPYCSKDKNAEWEITVSTSEGVEQIVLLGEIIYPDDTQGNPYYNAYYYR
ncbi:MAG: type II secretion system GspH family protein [Roseburia sp.]|nr:type II secretion system GspH family protein [Roseburia sp.]